MEDFALFPLAPKKGTPSKDDGSCDFISRGDGKGRGACLSQLIVRVIRNSGGIESKRDSGKGGVGGRGRKKRERRRRARKNGMPYSAPSWGKSHASRFYEYSRF